MKITKLGIVTAVKNVGVFLATYTFSGIKADPQTFIYALLIYACVSVPSDIYLLNKAHENGAKETPKEI